MRKEEIPSQMSASNPDCCLYFKSIQAENMMTDNVEPGIPPAKPMVLNNWMCTKEQHRCTYSMLRLGKMLHHTCHNAVKEIMHTKLANEPKPVEFYNDLNLKPEHLKPPKGYIWVDGKGWVKDDGSSKKGKSGDTKGFGFCTAKERFMQIIVGNRKRKC